MTSPCQHASCRDVVPTFESAGQRKKKRKEERERENESEEQKKQRDG